MRILVVEDEHKISAYVKRGLEEQGFAVDAAFTGAEALDWAASAPYDLIILRPHAPLYRWRHGLQRTPAERKSGPNPDAHRSRYDR